MGVITFKHQCIRPFANSSFFNSQRMSLDLLRRLIAPCEKASVGRDGLLARCRTKDGGKRDFRGPIYIFLSPRDFPSKWSVSMECTMTSLI